MTDKQLDLIYGYMGWGDKRIDCNSDCRCYVCDYPHHQTCKNCDDVSYCKLDSNDAWEVVQEMERKGDSSEFDEYYQDEWLEKGNPSHSYTLWSMNPDNFFRCFGAWLEQKLHRGVHEDKIEGYPVKQKMYHEGGK